MDPANFAVDWFNKTQYGPWPLWDAFANYTFSQVKTTRLQEDNEHLPATLGFATGTLLILALSSQTKLHATSNLKPKIRLPSQQVFDQLFKLVTAIILIPIVTLALLGLAVYRHLVEVYLNRRLLNGSDAVWALDADEVTSRAVINILALLDGNIDLEKLRNLVRDELIPISRKLSYRRKYSSFGYFYWEPTTVDVTELVRHLPGGEEGLLDVSEEELQTRISAVGNAPLPGKHTASWEVLLGPRVSTSDGPPRTALLFRVHHSLGDGPALFRVLLAAFADSQGSQHGSSTLAASRLQRLRIPQPLTMLKEGIAGLSALATLPPDQGPLHSQPLNGAKQLAWRCSARLLEAARGVRAATGAPFTAGLLAALTAALEDYSVQRGAQLSAFTVVVPARLPGQFNCTDNELDNAFSMVLVQLRPTKRSVTSLDRVRAAENALREASSLSSVVVNSWAVRLAGCLLPRPLAARLLYSHQCTAVMSNMPGPSSRLSIAGRPLSQLAFWVPHRGTTGVGASILSYAGQLTLSLNLDEALLTTPDDARRLMEAWESHLLSLEHDLRLATNV